ncbi:MAG: hypothetical protein WB660_30585 [Candidatus Sulfotelmatobacter sp.]
MKYLLMWAPEGRMIAEVEATDRCAALFWLKRISRGKWQKRWSAFSATRA